MNHQRLPYILTTTIISLVWFVNGFFCKILNLVPSHQEIVARILREQYSWFFTNVGGQVSVQFRMIISDNRLYSCTFVRSGGHHAAIHSGEVKLKVIVQREEGFRGINTAPLFPTLLPTCEHGG